MAAFCVTAASSFCTALSSLPLGLSPSHPVSLFSSLFSLSLTASSMLLQKKKKKKRLNGCESQCETPPPSPFPSSPLFSSWMVKDWSLCTDKQKNKKKKGRNLCHPTHSMLQSTDGDNTYVFSADSRVQGFSNTQQQQHSTDMFMQFNI